MVASENGCEGVVERLLNHRDILVNAKREGDGATPLFFASKNGHLNVVNLLPFNNEAQYFSAINLKNIVSDKSDAIKERMYRHIGGVEDDFVVSITSAQIAEIMGHTDVFNAIKAKESGESVCHIAGIGLS